MLPAIEIKQVCKSFGALQALSHIDLEINQGEFFALLGPNGAGKTTLISIIAGLSIANSGNVRIMGHDVITQYQEARRMLGVVPQELVFDPFFTVRESLVIQSGYYGVKHNAHWIDEIIHHLDLTDKANTNMRALSGGMKRRVLVAQALVHKPPVIILDEPTAGVDVALRQTLWKFIQRLNHDGHTIILTTHYLEEAEALCNRVAMLKQGQIVALDNMQKLVGKSSNHLLRLKLSSSELPAVLAAQLVSDKKGSHLLKINDYAQIEPILALLREADIKLIEMEILQPDLEEVFVNIMAQNQNDRLSNLTS